MLSRRRSGSTTLAAVTLAILYACAPVEAAERGVTSDEHRLFVRPLLAQRCLGCHAQASAEKEGRFRVDLPLSVPQSDGESASVVPGDPDASELWRRVTSSDDAVRMPPPGAGEPLTLDERARLRRWIEAGAPSEPFWADVSPADAIADGKDGSSLLAERSSDGPAAPIGDATIDRQLELAWAEEGVEPSPRAADAVWLRRATYALTGLPPTPGEIDRFLADESPDRRERVVDRLLASPRYGERMAALWLDAARYADTHGYHADAHRDQWRWRDWVIGAFNANLPYDRFVVDQLAGDLTEPTSTDRRLATGFLRNHMINFEDGAFAEEYRVEYVADRVHTVAQALLGTTLSCARCHDHPYDPITTEDYYRFFAFFDRIDDNGLDGEHGNAVPIAPAPTRPQREAIADLEARLANVERTVAERESDFVVGQRVWERRLRAEGEFVATPTDAIVEMTFDDEDDTTSADTHADDSGARVVGSPIPIAARTGSGRQLLLDGDSSVVRSLDEPLTLDGGVTIAGWYFFTGDEDATLWELSGVQASTDVESDDDASSTRLRLVASADESVFRLLISRGDAEFASESWRWTHATNVWFHLLVRIDAKGEALTMQIFADGKPLKASVAESKGDVKESDTATDEKVLNEDERQTLADVLRGQRFATYAFGGANDARGVSGMVDEARLFDRALGAAEIDALAGGSALASALSLAEADRSETQSATLADWYRRNVDPIAADLMRRRDEIEAELRAERASVPTAMVARDADGPRVTHVLLRGRYDAPGEAVSPRALDFGSFAGDVARPDRLGLAEWMIRDDHPRTSRVAVDRLWRIALGEGLVGTPEDFGLRGEPPVHRELLDRLANEFVESGWDVKAMMRRLALSRAFALSDEASERLARVDGDNRLFARYPARRLEAEMTIDRLRFAAGTLQERLGGRSVFGFEPGDRWKELSYSPSDLTAQLYRRSTGEDLYRRAVYSFWKRASPPVTLSLFDASNRETCRLRREETRTPLQALALLNDPTALDAYRALGCRLAGQNDRDDRERLTEAFRWAVSRAPTVDEMKALGNELNGFRDALSENPDDATAVLAGGYAPLPTSDDDAVELAAWTLIVTLTMNLPEALEY